MTLTPRSYLTTWLIGAALTALILLTCLCIGPGQPGTRTLTVGYPQDPAIRQVRLYPLLSAAMVGAALAAAGVVLQSLLKNPLADPYILGLSSGAGVGAVAFIIYGNFLLTALSRLDLSLGTAGFAMIGATITCLAVFALARRRGSFTGMEAVTLVLVGVIVNAFNAGLVQLLIATAPRTQAQLDVMKYLMGDINDGIGGTELWIAAALLLTGWAIAVYLASAMNLASLSDEETASLGIKLSRLRFLSFASSSLLTAAAISLAGPIGFVGLICPHICRGFLGPDHRRLVAAAPFAGAIFLGLAFTFVHSTGAWFNGDLPIGVITALCGGPFFLLILRRKGVWLNA